MQNENDIKLVPMKFSFVPIEKIGTPLHSPVLLYESGSRGVLIARTCYPDTCIFMMMGFLFDVTCIYLQILPTPSRSFFVSTACQGHEKNKLKV